MKNNKIPQAVAMILLTSALAAGQGTGAKPESKAATTMTEATPCQAEVIALVREFLAKVDDPAMHDRFWAEDLVYTSGMGVVRSKSDIMKSMRESVAAPKKEGEKPTTYTAEEITVKEHGEFAVLNFKLVAKTEGEADKFFRNTGTLRKRNGKWQVIAWQATPIVHS